MNGKRKYSNDEISAKLKCYGFKLIEYKNICDVIAEDAEGYRYKINMGNLKLGRKPNRFASKYFAIYNIKKYLEIHCPTYELLDNEYNGIKNKMRFICHNHLDKGIQINSIDNIVNNGHFCKYCSFEKMRDDRILNIDILDSLCKDRKVSYYGRYTKNHETVVQYKCDKHNNFIQEMTLTHFRYSSNPCKYCGISSGELKIADFLNNHQIRYIKEKTFDGLVSDNNKKLRFDYYLTDYNILIEYDGKQHFEPVKFWNGQNSDKSLLKNQYHDELKNKYCLKNNIRLIRIPYTKYNQIESILASELSDVF